MLNDILVVILISVVLVSCYAVVENTVKKKKDGR